MKLLLALAAALAVVACAPAGAPPAGPAADTAAAPAKAPMAKPVIADAWAAATAEGVKVSAGYMTITNPGDIADRLVSASTPAAGKTELHLMENENGVMKMRQAADGIAAPAGGAVNFAPGGTHVMFFDLPAPLKDGTTIPVTLTFEKSGPIEVQFAVRPRTAADKPADKPADHKH